MSASQASKTDLINALAQKHEVSKATAEIWVNTVLDTIGDLAIGQKLILRGFGTFEVKHKPAGTARNPRTGVPVEVAARSVLTFKAAKPSAKSGA